MDVPNDVDGQVITEIFKKGSDANTRDVKYKIIETKSRSEKDKLRTIKFSKKI